jgi:DNA-directed RNA polymerase specialized sigma24 family protein
MRPDDDTSALAQWQELAGMDCNLRAAEDFFRTHACGVYNLVARLLGDPAKADDLTLEVLLEAIEDPTMPSGEGGAARLREAAVRAVQSHRLHAGRPRTFRRPRALSYPLLDTAGPAQVEQALAGLPAAHRDAFVLVDVESMASEDAAALLGVGPLTLKRRLHNARLLVRDSLFQQDQAAAASGQDRRKARRDPANLAAFVRLAAGTEATRAVVADRSSGGLALWVTGPLTVGSPLFVQPEPSCETARWLRVEVRHCHERESGGWAVGCRVVG